MGLWEYPFVVFSLLMVITLCTMPVPLSLLLCHLICFRTRINPNSNTCVTGFLERMMRLNLKQLVPSCYEADCNVSHTILC